MTKSYDDIINSHYRKIALEDGLSSKSTMPDDITRSTETDAIVSFIADVTKYSHQNQLQIVDVGCGNGYTLEVLANKFKELKFIGIEKSSGLRNLARSRFIGSEQVEIIEGDIRDPHFIQKRAIDIIICQRVIINILDKEDQKRSLDNILQSVRRGSKLLFIEAFNSPLMRLNEARAEFDLLPIKPAYHNLYLDDDFFVRPDLVTYSSADWYVPPNFLSTHYYISRVLHPLLTANTPSRRNSAFVQFFSKVLPPAIGDFSQLKLFAFVKD